MHAKAIRRIEAANGVQSQYMYDVEFTAWEDTGPQVSLWNGGSEGLSNRRTSATSYSHYWRDDKYSAGRPTLCPKARSWARYSGFRSVAAGGCGRL